MGDYEKIPENDRKLFDLKIVNANYELLEKKYVLDIGMNRLEVDLDGNNDFWYSSRIIDQGDLSTYYGYETFDASEYTIIPGKIYPEIVEDMGQIDDLTRKLTTLLKSGYTYVRMANIPTEMKISAIPIHIIGKNHELAQFKLEVGANPTFLLEKEGVVNYAVVNGFLIDLNEDVENLVLHFTSKGKNAMIFR